MKRLVSVMLALAIGFTISTLAPVAPVKADTGPILLITVAEQIASNLKHQYSFETLIVIENDQIIIYGWKPRASLSKPKTPTFLPSSPPDLKIIVGACDVWK